MFCLQFKDRTQRMMGVYEVNRSCDSDYCKIKLIIRIASIDYQMIFEHEIKTEIFKHSFVISCPFCSRKECNTSSHSFISKTNMQKQMAADILVE